MECLKKKIKPISLILLLIVCFIAEFFLFRSRSGYEHIINFISFNFFNFSQQALASLGAGILIFALILIFFLIRKFDLDSFIEKDFSFEPMLVNKKIFCFIAPGVILLVVFCIFFSEIYAFNILNLLFVFSILFILIGTAFSTNIFTLLKKINPPPKSEIIFFLLLITTFTILVLPLINYIPYFVETDEGNVGNFSREFFHNKEIMLWDNISGALPSISFLPGFISLLFISNDLWGLRFSSFFIALLSLIIYYVALRVSFDKTTAALSSIVLSCSAYFIGFSRTGYNNIDSILIYTIVFASFMAAFRSRNLFFIFLAGITAFSSLYLYVGTRIIILIALAFILFALMTRQINFKVFLKMTLSFLLGGIIIAAPYITNIIKNFEPSVSRAQSIFYLTSEPVLKHMKASYNTDSTIEVIKQSFIDSTLGLVYIPVKTSTSNNLGRPVLDFFGSVFFLIGFIYAITRIKDLRINFVMISFFMLLFAIALAIDAPTIHRVIIFFPVISLIVALGLMKISTEISELFSANKHKKLCFSIITSLCVLLMCLSNIEVYFLNYVVGRCQYAMYEKKSIISNIVAKYQDKFDIYIVYNDFIEDFNKESDIINLNEPASEFLINGIDKTKIINVKNNLKNLKINHKVDKDVILFLDKYYIKYLKTIMEYYKITNLYLFSNPKGEPLFFIIKVLKEDVNKLLSEK